MQTNNVKILGPGGTQQIYDFSKSNLVLMIGGQILFIALIIMVILFGTPPMSFPANAVRNMLKNTPLNKNIGLNSK